MRLDEDVPRDVRDEPPPVDFRRVELELERPLAVLVFALLFFAELFRAVLFRAVLFFAELFFAVRFRSVLFPAALFLAAVVLAERFSAEPVLTAPRFAVERDDLAVRRAPAVLRAAPDVVRRLGIARRLARPPSSPPGCSSSLAPRISLAAASSSAPWPSWFSVASSSAAICPPCAAGRTTFVSGDPPTSLASRR